MNLGRDLQEKIWPLLFNQSSHAENEHISVPDVKLATFRRANKTYIAQIRDWDTVEDRASVGFTVYELLERCAASFLNGYKNTGVAFQCATSYPVTKTSHPRAQVTGGLRKMDRANTRNGALIGGAEKIETILEILLVQMNHIRSQLSPLLSDAV